VRAVGAVGAVEAVRGGGGVVDGGWLGICCLLTYSAMSGEDRLMVAWGPCVVEDLAAPRVSSSVRTPQGWDGVHGAQRNTVGPQQGDVLSPRFTGALAESKNQLHAHRNSVFPQPQREDDLFSCFILEFSNFCGVNCISIWEVSCHLPHCLYVSLAKQCEVVLVYFGTRGARLQTVPELGETAEKHHVLSLRCHAAYGDEGLCLLKHAGNTEIVSDMRPGQTLLLVQ
jgi:hypothetical protein